MSDDGFSLPSFLLPHANGLNPGVGVVSDLCLKITLMCSMNFWEDFNFPSGCDN